MISLVARMAHSPGRSLVPWLLILLGGPVLAQRVTPGGAHERGKGSLRSLPPDEDGSGPDGKDSLGIPQLDHPIGTDDTGPGTVFAQQKLSATEGGLPLGPTDWDQLGSSVCGLGDLDGDGVADLAVGAPGDTEGFGDAARRAGALYVLFLHADGTVKRTQRINSLHGGFTGSLDSDDEFGASLAPLGDLDGDGLPELVVGAPGDENPDDPELYDRGSIWILHLDSEGTVREQQRISELEGGFQGQLDVSDQFGTSVASLGDVDGDGFQDIAVGASGSASSRGAVWILFLDGDGRVKAQQRIARNEGGLPGVVAVGDEFGSSIAAIDDLDGDGIQEIAVGAKGTRGGRGRVWILFLDPDGTVRSFVRIGPFLQGGFSGTLDPVDWFGASVTTLDDLDGDGIHELAAGTPNDDDGETAAGSLCVLFLNADGTVRSQQKISSTEGGFTGTLSSYDRMGGSLAVIGDLDGDGMGDVVAGAPGDDDGGGNRGALWFLDLGSGGTVSSEHKISALEGGLPDALGVDRGFGSALCGLGDLDADGVMDLAVGEPGRPYRPFPGGLRILFMNTNGTVKLCRSIGPGLGGFSGELNDGDAFGSSLAPIGDLDGDGVVDLAVGASDGDGGGLIGDRGTVWVLFLGSDGTVKSQQEIGLNRGGFTGVIQPDDFFGAAIASLGDLDADGVPDIAVGAPGEDEGGNMHGAIWVLFLNSDGTVKAHQKISAFHGFSESPGPFRRLGSALASLGDLDGDGVVDLAAGDYIDGDGGPSSGAVRVLFLQSDGTVKSLRKISATEGGFEGELDPYDRFGSAVGFAGDLDGDGVGDLAVGAYGDRDGGMAPERNIGAVWILFLEPDGTVKSQQKISATHGGFESDLVQYSSFGTAVAAPGDLNGDGLVELAVGLRDVDDDGNKGAVWMLFMDGLVALDMEVEDDFETALVNGQSISSPPEFGRLVEVNGFGYGNYGTAIFDSTPGGPNAASSDPDLLIDHGNLLLLQEDQHQTVPGIFDHPDDAQLGGTMVFDFLQPVGLHSVDLVDIDYGPPAQDVVVTLFDAGGAQRNYFVPDGWTTDLFRDGPPGFGTLDLTTLELQAGFMSDASASETVGFDPTSVVRVEVFFSSSGALDDLVYDPHP